MRIDDNLKKMEIEQCSYSSILVKYSQRQGPVSAEEHILFLLSWICKYFICTSSNKFIKEFFSIVAALSSGKPLTLGPFALSYCSLNDLVDAGNVEVDVVVSNNL